MELSKEAIIATRKHFADSAQYCIDEVLSGDVVLPSHMSQDAYFKWQRQRISDSLAGLNDHTFTFKQYAQYVQMSGCCAILRK